VNLCSPTNRPFETIPGFVVISDRKPFDWNELRCPPLFPNHAFLSEVLSAQQATQRVDVWWKVQKRLFGSPETMRLEAPEDYAEVPGLSLEEAKALVRLRLKRSGPYARPRDAGPESPAPAPES
jgi:hypothetical protein